MSSSTIKSLEESLKEPKFIITNISYPERQKQYLSPKQFQASLGLRVVQSRTKKEVKRKIKFERIFLFVLLGFLILGLFYFHPFQTEYGLKSASFIVLGLICVAVIFLLTHLIYLSCYVMRNTSEDTGVYGGKGTCLIGMEKNVDEYIDIDV